MGISMIIIACAYTALSLIAIVGCCYFFIGAKVKTDLNLTGWDKKTISQKVDQDVKILCALRDGLKIMFMELRAGLRSYASLVVQHFSNTQ